MKYLADVISWARRLRRGKPVARSPAMTAITNNVAITLKVTAGTSSAVGYQSFSSHAGPGPSKKAVKSTTPPSGPAALKTP